MKVKKIEATALFVKDIEKSKEFYIKKLGMKKTEEEEDFVNLKIGKNNIALLGPKIVKQLINENITSPGNSCLITAEVDNLDKTYKELKSKGIKFMEKPKMQDWGQYTTYFKDPDGHIWEICTFKK